MNEELNRRINALAEIISGRGIHPWRLWERNNIPADIDSEYQAVLQFWARLNNPSGTLTRIDFPVVELHNELTRHYVENEDVEKEYDNRTYSIIEKKNILLVKYPELKGRFDKYGLITIPPGIYFYRGRGVVGDIQSAQYGLRYKDHVLLLHRYFRRAFYKLNHFNEDLLGKLEEYQQKSLGSMKVRLDPYMLGRLDTFRDYFEKDYWHGKPFSIDSVDDPHVVGFTTHKQGDDILPNGMYKNRTEFLWYSEGPDIKTLEIEELWGTDQVLSSNRVYHDGKYYVRFIHCRRDIKKGRFIHLDGSINIYTDEEFAKRSNTRLGRDAKLGAHVKLFQIDGDIPYEDFNNIVQFFFRGNGLIQEYFENTAAFTLEPL